MGESLDVRPARLDHAPDVVVVAGKREGNWFALVVPPGHWRIAGTGSVGFCLGSPAFAVAAGEVVYAGTFSLTGADLAPDLAIEPAAAWLGGDFGTRVRPAAYRNGSRDSCIGSGVSYALEFPGAPFEPGYAWGGALPR